MVWGRKRREEKGKKDGPHPWEMSRAAACAAVFGALVCVLFLCAAAGGRVLPASYPTALSEAAVQTFLAEHAAFADAIGLDAYFPDAAVAVGSFSSRGEEAYRVFVEEGQQQWSFRDYLADAFRTLFGGT